MRSIEIFIKQFKKVKKVLHILHEKPPPYETENCVTPFPCSLPRPTHIKLQCLQCSGLQSIVKNYNIQYCILFFVFLYYILLNISYINTQTSTICVSMAAMLTGTFQVLTFDRHILTISMLYIWRKTALSNPILKK